MNRITVLGAGTMGRGIAQVAATAGHSVVLHDLDPAALDGARAKIEKTLAGGVERGKLTPAERDRALAGIAYEADFATSLAHADFVIEAVVEKLEVKKDLFGRAEGMVGEDTVLASNTSSLPITKIAGDLARPERVIGMHFFNPVHIMSLVEVVVGRETSPSVKERTLELVSTLGKEPVVVNDAPGFASSRLGIVLGLEAMRMVEQGVASPRDIDRAMELGYRHPMGPLRLTDLVGLDVRLSIAEALSRELDGDQYRPPEILRRLVAEGKLGKKSGEGFYRWDE
jgi:3-hydroxybutyryl-CoA dehydrogenase